MFLTSLSHTNFLSALKEPKAKTSDQFLQLMLKQSALLSPNTAQRLEGFLFAFRYVVYSLKSSTPAFSHATVSCHSWSNSLAVRLEVDQGIACLDQLCNGYSSSLFDKLSHGSHLLRRNIDELSSVINYTYRGKRKDLQVSTLALPTSQQTLVTSFWKGPLNCWGCISYLGQAEQCASSQLPSLLLSFWQYLSAWVRLILFSK